MLEAELPGCAISPAPSTRLVSRRCPIPCGFSVDNLPLSLQLVGKPMTEGLLLRVAHAYQQVTDWHLRRPPLGE